MRRRAISCALHNVKNGVCPNKTMAGTRSTLVKLQQGLDPNSPLVVHLNQALESLDRTSRSVGELTDYLQRNPAALVRGRYVSDQGK